jgi:DNA-binding transcriptional regulator GbsR (MarR family)
MRRPASTVSREVVRNGGPERYRAERAHRAAGRRDRRPVPPAEPATGADAYGRDCATVRGVVERLAASMIQAGLAAMPARVLACLLADDTGGMTATELVERLQVSAGSVSKAVRYLEQQLGWVHRERGARRERYLVHDDVWYRAWKRAAQACAAWVDATRRGAELLGATTPAGARLAETSQFLELVALDAHRSADHWWQVLSEHRRGIPGSG